MAKTSAQTVATRLSMLLDTLTENIDPDLPALRGRTDGSEADVTEVAEIKSITPGVRLTLSDGTVFRVEVHQVK